MSSQKTTSRVGVDARLAGQSHAGIGRYTENLLRRLPVLGQDLEWVFFFTSRSQARQVLNGKSYPHVQIQIAPIGHYSWAEQVKLPGVFLGQKLDLLHVPHFNVPILYPGKLIVTIHDLLWHQQRGSQVTTLPELTYWAKYLGYRLVARSAIHKSKAILVPAKTIKKTIIDYYPATKHKIIVTPEGSSLSHTQKPNFRRLTNKKQLVYVGSLYPHKNLHLVITALHQLKDFKLIIVSSRDAFFRQTQSLIKEEGLENQVEFCSKISDQALVKLLGTSLALVQPSLSEGFGLTGIEAMSVGIPVLASNIPIFREIYQDGVIYFNPKSVDSFLDAVEQLGKGNQEQLLHKAYRIANTYSWDTMTKQTLAAYHQVLTSS